MSETLAYLSGCDVENATEAEIPVDATYVFHGASVNGDGIVFFTDKDRAFQWMLANVGATVAALKVERSH